MIYNTDSEFDFDSLVLKSPIQMSGGHFIKYAIKDAPLYLKPPKCHIKQLTKSQNKKKMNCDLQFSKEDVDFILWFNHLVKHTRKTLYDNREKWFDAELELKDIENSFIDPLKSYKSGKFYLTRTAIPMKDDIVEIKIYDENENEVPIDELIENMEVMTIMECKGIKCSTRNFQIEIELKQILVKESKNIFEKCILTNGDIKEIKIKPFIEKEVKTEEEYLGNIDTGLEDESVQNTLPHIMMNTKEETLVITEEKEEKQEKEEKEGGEKKEEKKNEGICEVEFNLEEIPDIETVQLKKRNEVYYEMYREARRKAKVARDLALSAYLEAKRIKNTYMLDNLKESDESDNDFDEEDVDSEENIDSENE